MAKAVTNSLTKKRRRVSDIVLKSLIFLSSGIVVALTLGMIIYIAVKGTEGMSLNFLTTPAFSYPYENYGVLGNIIAEAVLKIFRIKEPVAKGLAIGTASHAIGTTKALEIGEIEGAMSSLSVAVAGLMTVISASIFANMM